MDDPRASTPGFVRRALDRFGPVPFLVAAAILGLVVFVLARNAVYRRALAREREKIRAAGEPASLDELASSPIPEDLNAAVVFEGAFKKLDAGRAVEPEGWARCLQDRDVVFDPESIEGALKVHAAAMTLAREALGRPSCRFDLDYAKGIEMELPHLGRLRKLARLFAGEAHLHAHSGRAAEAADSLRCVFALAHAMDEEPIHISKLVSVSIVGIGITALQKVEHRAPLADSSRQELIAKMREIDLRRAATQSMIGERLMLADGFEQVSNSWVFVHGKRAPARWIASRWKGLPIRGRLDLMRVMTEMVAASRLPPWEALPKVGAISKRRDAILEAYVCCNALGEVNVYVRFARAMASRDSAVVGLSCELYRSAHGDYPASLDELAREFLPEIPPDPFTGNPFVYRVTHEGEGFIVYSVGPNLTDDGGVSERDAGKDDISWEREPAPNAAGNGVPAVSE